jgi:hypothetical protein
MRIHQGIQPYVVPNPFRWLWKRMNHHVRAAHSVRHLNPLMRPIPGIFPALPQKRRLDMTQQLMFTASGSLAAVVQHESEMNPDVQHIQILSI